MTENVWLDFTYFCMWAVCKKSGICFIIWHFSFYHWYIQFQRLQEVIRNYYFWLVYSWYMALWYTYNNLFLLCPSDNMSCWVVSKWCRQHHYWEYIFQSSVDYCIIDESKWIVKRANKVLLNDIEKLSKLLWDTKKWNEIELLTSCI